MSELFISTLKPPDETSRSDYQVDIEEFTNQMAQKWPFAKIIKPSSNSYVLTWELNEEQFFGTLGGLQSDRKTATFGVNYLDSALDYILWHREFVPDDVSLYLFDANLIILHELTLETTREELISLIQSIL